MEAGKIIAGELQADLDVQGKIREVIREASERLFTGDSREKLVEKVQGAIAEALRCGGRYQRSHPMNQPNLPSDDVQFLISEFQRLQPVGSPPPGDFRVLVQWIRISVAEELHRLRETNKRLNRRCQSADAAVADAKRCIDEMCRKQNETGTPWCGGSFGRALLAYGYSRQEEEIEALRAQLREHGIEPVKVTEPVLIRRAAEGGGDGE